jgi:hypothetical protein
MKRCTQCNRLETEAAVKFCRVDGATLVADSDSIGSELGTAQLGTSPASEVHTSILPPKTDANINRATAPTTVLPLQPNVNTTSELSKPKRRKTAILIAVSVTAVIAAASAILVDAYRSKSSSGGGFGQLARLRDGSDSDKEKVMKNLVEQADRGSFWLFLIKTDPRFDPLRNDPRFKELLKKFDPPK